MSDDPRHLGRLGERLAAEHFERLGYRILARNYRTRFGELDLVVTDEEVLVFCEVKTRRSGSPWENLGVAKRGQVRRMARAWLAQARDRPRRRSCGSTPSASTSTATARSSRSTT